MTKKLYLIAICLIATLGGFLFGFDTAVISGTLAFIKAQFDLTPLMEGWYVGSALLGCIIGVAFAGILADKYGRKKTIRSFWYFTLTSCGIIESLWHQKKK